jgi:hypothetical protein
LRFHAILPIDFILLCLGFPSERAKKRNSSRMGGGGAKRAMLGGYTVKRNLDYIV